MASSLFAFCCWSVFTTDSSDWNEMSKVGICLGGVENSKIIY